MDIKGEFRIPLPQDAVWRALNDTEILKASIPGCDELIREGDTAFKGQGFRLGRAGSRQVQRAGGVV